ncbi:MAG: AmmeMemoRadiSam system radical SAM enzyme [Candidatus Bipolaricaulaceae bacterium]
MTCERRCLLAPGQVGFCRTRENRGGRIHTLVYGLLSSISLNPMEKKPFYHLYPGQLALTCGTWSCNFTCPWCQNWEISKRPPDPHAGTGYFSPEDFLDLANKLNAQGVSLSFNEPTLLLEWAVELFPLAHQAGLHTNYVTNGYMTEEALELLVGAGLDGVNIDIKGSAQAVRRFCQADQEKVWRNARLFREKGVHVEVTTLVIPGVNDTEEDLLRIAERILAELGPWTPWHVTRYFPAFAFRAPSTPVSALERAQKIGFKVGLQYVYVGNVPGHPGQNTYCPGCKALLVEREGVSLVRRWLQGPRCPRCGEFIPIRENPK